MAPPIRRLLKQRDSYGARLREAQDKIELLQANSSLAQFNSADAEERIRRELLEYDSLPAGQYQPPPIDPRRIELTDDDRAALKAVLLKTYFKDWLHADTSSSAFIADLNDHVENRFNVFSQHIIPWIKSLEPELSSMTVLEVGSGTGASTLAFASQVERAVCFEIDTASIAAAKGRMARFGLDNVEFREELFGPECEFVRTGGSADLIVLCAVLEHMTFEELGQTLRCAWRILKEGGILVVADTPNRLAAFDGHTSLLPYFAALPLPLMEKYAAHSPRDAFSAAIGSASATEREMLLTRWGRGISYHDFVLALGTDFSRHIVLDGYERIICDCCPLGIDDAILRFSFAQHGIDMSRAFTRANMYFVARK